MEGYLYQYQEFIFVYKLLNIVRCDIYDHDSYSI
jgi:hypothetical protein